jgi:hypothetical protein
MHHCRDRRAWGPSTPQPLRFREVVATLRMTGGFMAGLKLCSVSPVSRDDVMLPG